MADSTVSDKPSNKINSNVNATSNSFFLSSCSPEEVFDLIKKLKKKKAKRALDTEVKFIKQSFRKFILKSLTQYNVPLFLLMARNKSFISSLNLSIPGPESSGYL